MPLNLFAKLFLKSLLGSGLRMRKGVSIYAVVIMAIATSITSCSLNPTNSPSIPITTTNTTTSTAKTESLPLVVATNSVVCDLTKQIAGNTIDLNCLVEGGTDVHLYQPKPEDRKAIDSAKLVLYGGYNFEANLIKLIQASPNSSPKVAVNEVAVPHPLIAEVGHDHEDKKGDKEADPHVWNDAQNGIKIAQAIRKSLSTLRPDQAETYAKNAGELVHELEQIDAWIKVQIATIPVNSRKLITTHDALGYYARAYGIPVEGALNGLSTEEQPTPTRFKELVTVIKSSQVPTIFAEISINPKLIMTVAKEANVKVADRQLYADGLGAKGGEAETYTDMLIANTRTIVEGLGGKYTPFKSFNKP
jgi:manganese/iron transport system substrate-binding protein